MLPNIIKHEIQKEKKILPDNAFEIKKIPKVLMLKQINKISFFFTTN